MERHSGRYFPQHWRTRVGDSLGERIIAAQSLSSEAKPEPQLHSPVSICPISTLQRLTEKRRAQNGDRLSGVDVIQRIPRRHAELHVVASRRLWNLAAAGAGPIS